MLYYNIFFAGLYFDAAYIMSYIGLFLIFTKLGIYFSENSFNEVKVKLMEDGLNLKLRHSKLKK